MDINCIVEMSEITVVKSFKSVIGHIGEKPFIALHSLDVASEGYHCGC